MSCCTNQRRLSKFHILFRLMPEGPINEKLIIKLPNPFANFFLHVAYLSVWMFWALDWIKYRCFYEFPIKNFIGKRTVMKLVLNLIMKTFLSTPILVFFEYNLFLLKYLLLWLFPISAFQLTNIAWKKHMIYM